MFRVAVPRAKGAPYFLARSHVGVYTRHYSYGANFSCSSHVGSCGSLLLLSSGFFPAFVETLRSCMHLPINEMVPAENSQRLLHKYGTSIKKDSLWQHEVRCLIQFCSPSAIRLLGF